MGVGRCLASGVSSFALGQRAGRPVKRGIMRAFFAASPGAIWAAIILGLSLGAIWLNDYMGDVVPPWLPPLILTVLVPVLKVLATNEQPATRSMGEVIGAASVVLPVVGVAKRGGICTAPFLLV